MDYKTLLSLLCDTMTVGGYEGTAQKALADAVAPDFDEYHVDALGNHLFVRRSGASDAKRLLIDAHLDEIGMLVSEIAEEGFLRFVAVGGLDRRTLPSADVVIHASKPIRGVISSIPPHLQAKEEREVLPEVHALWIDTGYSKEELEALGVHIGTPITLYSPVTELENGVLCGASFDNKACCAAALIAAQQARLPDGWDLLVLLSAREETSGVGGFGAAYGLTPDAAIVLDGNLAKTAHTKAHETVALFGGPSVSLSAMTDRALTRSILTCAREHAILHQCIVEAEGTGTNADSLSVAANGVPCAVVSLPLRHMHTPTELIARADADALISLLVNWIEGGLSAWYRATAIF